MRALTLAVLAACAPARHATLAGASTAALAVDWAQTRDITRHCRESNPILGACGERFPVDVYFPLALAANLAAGYLLGDWLWGVTLGGEADAVIYNWRYK